MFEKKYKGIGWHNIPFRLTAEEFRNRVIKDAESNYNWIASATEIVRVCSIESFPQDFAIEIKRAVLNCFANLVTAIDEAAGYEEPTDQRAVRECYNTLDFNNEVNKKIKRKYVIEQMIAIVWHHSVLPPTMIYGNGF